MAKLVNRQNLNLEKSLFSFLTHLTTKQCICLFPITARRTISKSSICNSYSGGKLKVKKKLQIMLSGMCIPYMCKVIVRLYNPQMNRNQKEE